MSQPVRSGPLKERVHGGVRDERGIVGDDYASLYAFLGGFDVFIHPSCYAADRDCEGGAPVVLLDAQATGMPVIATTHCDIPEEVVHGETGLLSAEKDVARLAESIRFFYRLEEEDYQPWSLAARRHVETNYDAKKSGLQLKAVYQSLKNKLTF